MRAGTLGQGEAVGLLSRTQHEKRRVMAYTYGGANSALNARVEKIAAVSNHTAKTSLFLAPLQQISLLYYFAAMLLFTGMPSPSCWRSPAR